MLCPNLADRFSVFAQQTIRGYPIVELPVDCAVSLHGGAIRGRITPCKFAPGCIVFGPRGFTSLLERVMRRSPQYRPVPTGDDALRFAHYVSRGAVGGCKAVVRYLIARARNGASSQLQILIVLG